MVAMDFVNFPTSLSKGSALNGLIALPGFPGMRIVLKLPSDCVPGLGQHPL